MRKETHDASTRAQFRIKGKQSYPGMIQRIVSRFRSEKIILFGSHARGKSCYRQRRCLLVVMSVSGSKREKQLEIRLALQDFHIPKDIVVTTAEDFE
jgi:hypothetical protein